jgi:hypothetical protein
MVAWHKERLTDLPSVVTYLWRWLWLIVNLMVQLHMQRPMHNFRDWRCYLIKNNFGPSGDHHLRSCPLSRVCTVPSPCAIFKCILGVVRFCLDHLYCVKMAAFQFNFQSGKQSKSKSDWRNECWSYHNFDLLDCSIIWRFQTGSNINIIIHLFCVAKHPDWTSHFSHMLTYVQGEGLFRLRNVTIVGFYYFLFT